MGNVSIPIEKLAQGHELLSVDVVQGAVAGLQYISFAYTLISTFF